MKHAFNGYVNMRSNDQAHNYAFKPTAGEVVRTNQPPRAGDGLTRR
jgi:hypothetical protein